MLTYLAKHVKNVYFQQFGGVMNGNHVLKQLQIINTGCGNGGRACMLRVVDSE
jgi:hypothetical protein